MHTDQDETDGYVTQGGASGLPGTRTGCVSPPHAAFRQAMPSTLKQSPSSRAGAEHGLRPTAPAAPCACRASSCPRWAPARIWAVCLLFSSEDLKQGNYTLARSQPSPSHPVNPLGLQGPARVAGISGLEQGAGGELRAWMGRSEPSWR